jgi:hypothetical protein
LSPRGAARRATLALWVASAAAVAHAAPGERYLVIGASDASPAVIARRAQALADAAAAAGDGHGLVLSTADCGDRRAVFAWVAVVADSIAAAQAALVRLKGRVPDAYVKRCIPRPGSLLALGVPAVDASIADVPDDAVNWSDADRVSSVLLLVGSGTAAGLVLQRHYVAVADDPLEGRRARVLLVQPGAAPQTLIDDCGGAQRAVLSRGWLALTCDSEQAADHVLHTVHAFTAAGAPVVEVPRCRQPRFTGVDTLQCQTEAVDAQGRLRLAPRSVRLVRP